MAAYDVEGEYEFMHSGTGDEYEVIYVLVELQSPMLIRDTALPSTLLEQKDKNLTLNINGKRYSGICERISGSNILLPEDCLPNSRRNRANDTSPTFKNKIKRDAGDKQTRAHESKVSDTSQCFVVTKIMKL